MTAATGTDPQTLFADDSPGTVDVNANRSAPNTFGTGGVAEFDGITDPVVALQGSGTADALYLLIHLNTTGYSGIGIIQSPHIDVLTQCGPASHLARWCAQAATLHQCAAGYIADSGIGSESGGSGHERECNPAGGGGNQTQVQRLTMTTNAVSNDVARNDDITVTAQHTTAVTLRTLTARAPLTPLAALPVAALVLTGGLVALRRRKG